MQVDTHSHPSFSPPPFSPIGVETTQDIVVHETLRGLLRPAMAELIGSGLFVFIACGCGMTTTGYHSVGAQSLGIAFTFGMSIFVLAYSIGHISGGHLNFAVTLTFACLRKISILKCGLYFLAQFIGGLIGIGFLKLVTPQAWWGVSLGDEKEDAQSRGMRRCEVLVFLNKHSFDSLIHPRPSLHQSCFAANFIHTELTVGHALITEFILTFFLMFVVMAACDSNKSNQTLVPFAIGMAVFCAHMLGLPITGCSINPTRSFASAAAASGLSQCPNAWEGHWVFWVSWEV